MSTSLANRRSRPEADTRGWIALVTGASSGIGEATARLLAGRGMHVILTARREERLRELASRIEAEGGSAEVLAADLTSEEERRSVFSRVMQEHSRLDVLVNNAGLGWYGYTAEMPWATAKEMLQVNVAATVQLTLLFLPEMQKRGWGHIVNVGSISGKLPNQGIAIYSATKSFLDSFTTAIYRELTGRKVRIGVVRPGPVITEFYDRAQKRSSGLRTPGEGFAVSAEKVAEAIWRMIRRPRKVIYVPGILGLSPLLERWFGWLIDRLGPLLLRRGNRRSQTVNFKAEPSLAAVPANKRCKS